MSVPTWNRCKCYVTPDSSLPITYPALHCPLVMHLKQFTSQTEISASKSAPTDL